MTYTLNELSEILNNETMFEYFVELYVKDKHYKEKFLQTKEKTSIRDIEKYTGLTIKMVDDDIDISNYILLARQIVIENVKCITEKPYNESWERHEYEKLKAIKWLRDKCYTVYGVNGQYILEKLYLQGFLKGYEYLLPNIEKVAINGLKSHKNKKN